MRLDATETTRDDETPREHEDKRTRHETRLLSCRVSSREHGDGTGAVAVVSNR